MSLMESAAILKVDKAVAQEALRDYRKHRAAATPEDEAIMRAYKEVARGRVVVQAIESIRVAGRDDKGLPRLAIIRADVRRCHCSTWMNSVCFTEASKWGRQGRLPINVDRFPAAGPCEDGTATVPLIPLPLRPKFALTNYHILWEADWQRAPADPLLLRRLKGDLWIVLAAWELTAIERAALEQRVNS